MSLYDDIKTYFQRKGDDDPMLDAELSLADPFKLFPKGQFQQYNPNKLVRAKGLKIFDEIRRDEQAKAALLFKKHCVMASGWDIQPPDGKDPDHDQTRFIKDQLTQLTGTLEENFKGVLSALDYGYSITEKIYTEIPDGEWSGLVGLSALKTRRPHSLTFNQDEFGNVVEIVQTTMDGPKRLPIGKFMVYSYMDEFGSPYGTSDLESAYRPWWFKDHAYKWLGMYLERFGIPPIFALYNPNKYKGATMNKLLSALKNLRAATSGAIPRNTAEDIELWTPEVAGQASTVFEPILKKYDVDISKAILMPTQLGVAPEESVGSQARAQTVFELFMFVIETLRKELAETVMNEQLVKPLYLFNFTDPDDCPKFVWAPIDDDANLELMKTWTDMISGGAVIQTQEDEAHIRSAMKFPERDMTKEPEPLAPGMEDDDPEPPPDGDDPADDDFMEKTGADAFVLSRDKNQYEKRVNFQQIDRRLTRNEKQSIAELERLLTDARDRMVAKYGNKDITAKMIRSIETVPNMPAFRRELFEFMSGNMEAGRETLRAELAPVLKFKDDGPNFTPTEAISHIRTKSIELASTTNAAIIKEVKQVLMTGLETGATGREVAANLKDAFTPWLGDPTLKRGDQQLKPHRLEVIVRTESTAAFNQGRLVEARSADIVDDMRGMEYSAIMDSRTTDVCKSLDGKMFNMGDPALDNLRPPNHFNCRSVLVPVTRFDEVNEADIVSPTLAGKASELAHQGFVK